MRGATGTVVIRSELTSILFSLSSYCVASTCTIARVTNASTVSSASPLFSSWLSIISFAIYSSLFSVLLFLLRKKYCNIWRQPQPAGFSLSSIPALSSVAGWITSLFFNNILVFWRGANFFPGEIHGYHSHPPCGGHSRCKIYFYVNIDTNEMSWRWTNFKLMSGRLFVTQQNHYKYNTVL